jgi:glycosyltransferase involved in cell wall biosynthesis
VRGVKDTSLPGGAPRGRVEKPAGQGRERASLGPSSISIVIPFYNEEANVRPLHQTLSRVLERLGREYEVIAVDDGSTDRTLSLLAEIHREDPRWRVLAFRRNFGQTAALAAGFDYARGESVVTLDADLQNDPEDIPKLLEMLGSHDVVSGWRADRRDAFLTRTLPSMLANKLISVITGVRLHDYGCTLKAYRREVIENLELYGDMHRFIPAVASWMGVSIAEVKVHHAPRRAGVSKYGLSRMMKVFLDLITVKFLLSFMAKPIRAFGGLGLALGGVGFLITLYLAALRLVLGESIGGRPLLLLGILLIVLGAQLIGMGLLGEILVRVYHEGLGKSIYAVRSILGDARAEPDVQEQGQAGRGNWGSSSHGM